MAKNQRTPLIKPREQGGTFYTFSSAIEDIGLNINELNNKVALSHYAVLDLPTFGNSVDGLFDVKSSGGDYTDSSNPGDYMFADGFQNYVLNLETVLRNQDVYNFSKSSTVSERIFWKWLESSMDLVQDSNNPNYYIDNNEIVKAFGLITAGAQRSDSYGMYNETFVQIPSSFGRMKSYYKTVVDTNCYPGTFKCHTTNSSGNAVIENYSDFSNSKTKFGLSYLASTDSSDTYTIENPIQLELTLSNLRELYNDDSLTFDDLAIKGSGIDSDESFDYHFNAILLYYSIYDSTGVNILATNAYGILLLNNATPDGEGYKFPELEKIKSTNTTTGTSYAFRINIKPTNVYSGDFIIDDNSSPAYSMASDYSQLIRNLSASIDILNSNANILNVISTDYIAMKQLVTSMINKLIDIQKAIDNVMSESVRNINAQSISTSNAHISSLDSSVTIYDSSTGETVGTLDGSTLTITNMKVLDNLIATKLAMKELSVDNIKSNNVSDNLQIKGATFSGNNMFMTGDYYGNVQTNSNENIEPNPISEILSNLSVVWNRNFADADLGIKAPETNKVTSQYSSLWNALFDTNGNMNLTNAILFLFAAMKNIHSL